VIQTVFLDSGPLGLVTKPLRATEVIAINKWVRTLDRAGVRIVVPEIADYEIRRELIRAGATAGIARLDAFNTARQDRYLPISTGAMLRAADLWAEARNRGYATADPKAIDGDVILAAQVLVMGLLTSEFIVATDNVGHLSRYVPAAEWRNITP
jgi:predicted nucleic acid-binding protein